MKITLILLAALVSFLGCSKRVESPSAQDAPQFPDAANADNKILQLDGQSNYMRIEDGPSLHVFTNEITMELWFNASSFYPNSGAVNCLLRKNTTAGSENFFLRFRIMGGRPRVEMCPGSRIGILQAPYEFETGRWYHLAGTYDGRVMTVYVNGLRVKSAKASGSLQIDDSELLIGKGDPEFSQGEYFHGSIDEVRLWNVARSAQQIQADMKGQLTGQEPGLVAYWNFEGTSAEDRSPLHNDGDLLENARIIPRVANPAKPTQ